MIVAKRFITLLALATLCITGCSDDSPAEASPDAGRHDAAGADASGLADAADRADAADAGDPACQALFGAPNEATGLSSQECTPSCECGEPFTATTFAAEDLEWMRTMTLENSFEELAEDPYADEPPDTDGVCGIVLNEGSYRVETYASTEELEAAGASLTHWGPCGVCSTLENFAVYAATSDLTEPVRSCGIQNPSDIDANIACLEELGFDFPCAQIWAYNTRNTRSECLEPCLQNLGSSYNLPDGSLNACLECDERESGPVFKAFAGRTRRNSGLASAICRPCASVLPVTHDYLP